MGDGYDCAFVLAQVLFEPFDGLGIKMVGRLVEEQYVGFLKQQTAECDTTALTTAEVFHRSVLFGTAQSVHSTFEPTVEVPCIIMFEQFGQLALTLAELFDIGIGVGKLVVHFFVFLQSIDNVLDGLLHNFLDGLGVVELGFLLEIADAVARREDNLALIVLVNACDDFQQR